jgi:hypothetical protein
MYSAFVVCNGWCDPILKFEDRYYFPLVFIVSDLKPGEDLFIKYIGTNIGKVDSKKAAVIGSEPNVRAADANALLK